MKLKNNISIDTLLKEYEDKDVFNDAQLCNIKLGLMFGDDVTIYARPEFTYKQMDAITSGLVHNIDVTKYADSRYSHFQMLALKDGLLLGFDMRPFAQANLSYKQIRNEVEDMIFSGKCTLPIHEIHKYLNYLSEIGEF